MKSKQLIFLILILLSFQSLISQINKFDCKLYFKSWKITELDNKSILLIVNGNLINKSNDTLRYLSNSCSWQDFFVTDNRNIKIESSECDKNIQITEKVPPKGTKRIELRILFTKRESLSFKIGLGLTSMKPYTIYEIEDYNKVRKIIWSNKLKIQL